MTRRQPPYTGEPPRDLYDHPFYGLDLDEEQMVFRDAIWDAGNLLVVCNAYAGTGKTTIAIATGNLLVEYRRYRRMIYVANPVQEGRLGYLPGTVGEKSSVYAEPLYGFRNRHSALKRVSGLDLCGKVQRYVHPVHNARISSRHKYIRIRCRDRRGTELLYV